MRKPLSTRHSNFKHYLAALCLGGLTTAAFAPYSYVVAAFLGISGLFYFTTKASSSRQAFFTGWWFGFGHFVSGIYWVSYSLLVEPDRFAWLIPFAASLVPAYLAIFIGLCTLVTWCWKGKGISTLCVFCLSWFLAELLRGWMNTGFPWNLVGYIWAEHSPLLQLSSIVGIYGVGLITMLWLCVPASAFLYWKKGGKTFAALAALSFVAAFSWGHARIDNVTLADAKPVKAHVIQPNIEQRAKWDETTRYMGMIQNFILSKKAINRSPGRHLLVWPETAIPYFLNEEPELLKKIARDFSSLDAVIVAGSLSIDRQVPGNTPKLYNALYGISSDGNILARYHKANLVPFGEFIPLRTWFPFINKITHGGTDFSSGDGPATLLLGKNFPTISPLICYEAIFPSFFNVEQRPDILVNVTNDAWFGISSGPYQHLVASRVRAIEQGLPMLRSANTGISAIIDVYGRVVEHVPLSQRGYVSKNLPAKTKEAPLFVQYNIQLIGLLALIFALPIFHRLFFKK